MSAVMNPSDSAAVSEPWPLYGLADDIRPTLALALTRGPAALATIIALGEGGPRPVGTQMVFGQNGVAGFLSGGCIEADVETHARACLEDGVARRLVYGQGSPWPDIQLLCGARIEILVERILPEDPAARTLLDLAAARRPASPPRPSSKDPRQKRPNRSSLDGAAKTDYVCRAKPRGRWRLFRRPDCNGSINVAISPCGISRKKPFSSSLTQRKKPVGKPGRCR